MNRSPSQSGFSLIEMIVSLALFSIVVTITVGALLVLIASNQRFQNEQSVMTNLSFALDSMTREIRTGTNYFCASRPNYTSGPPSQRIFTDGVVLNPLSVSDCRNGNNGNQTLHGIAFLEGGQSVTGAQFTKIVYFHDDNAQTLFRRISGESAESIVSSDISITDAEFYVTSTDDLDVGNDRQPIVTIYLEAEDANGNSYQLQTSVTQRTLDL